MLTGGSDALQGTRHLALSTESGTWGRSSGYRAVRECALPRAAPAAGGYSLSSAIHRFAAAKRPIRSPETTGSTCIFPLAAYSHPRPLLAAPYPVPGVSRRTLVPHAALQCHHRPLPRILRFAVGWSVQWQLGGRQGSRCRRSSPQQPCFSGSPALCCAVPCCAPQSLMYSAEQFVYVGCNQGQGTQISIHCSGYLLYYALCHLPGLAGACTLRHMGTFSCGTLAQPRTAAALGGASQWAPGTEVPVRGLYSALFSLQHPGRILRDPVNMPAQCLAYAYLC